MSASATMSAPGTALCRVTVFGPGGRADVGVPAVTTVGELIPLLVRRMAAGGEPEFPGAAPVGSWVLQRLGEPPMDPDGTPETLDWLDGERLYLRPAEDPLPELDFDDIADGMATVISRRTDRWNETVNRRTFLGLAVAAFLTTGMVLFQGTGSWWAPVSAALAAVLLGVTVLVARVRGDGPLIALTGLAGCGYAVAAGVLWRGDGDRLAALPPLTVLTAALTAAGCAALLLGLQRTLAPAIPIVPFGVLGVAGFGAVVSVWLDVGLDLTGQQNAALVTTAAAVLLVVSPKIATRAARLRGPQLPRTSDELQIDIEPQPADQIADRVGWAENYLTVLVAGAAVVTAAGYRYLLADPTWVTQALAGIVAGLMLLRAREFRSVPQRLFLVLGGAVGAVLLAESVGGPLAPAWRLVALAGLLFCAHLLVLAALRPASRRLLPIWGHLGNILETCGALALVPLLLYLLGLYAWARGLNG